jgi:hypothetical protein
VKNRLSSVVFLIFVGALVAACREEEVEQDPRAIEPDRMCPGGPSCPDEGDDVLMAGAAKAVITPDLSDKDTFVDVNNNGDFEPPPIGTDTWTDRNGNGVWDFVWIAGFGMARPAGDVHDDLWARTLVLRWKSTTIAVVSLDLIGYFWDDIMTIRDAVADLDIDYVIVSGTHNHEAPDIIGIWGFDELTPGWDQEYIDMVGSTAAQTVRDAYETMVPAKVAFGRTVPAHPTRGVCNVVLDGRDPFIIEDRLTTMRFIDAADESTIATVINWTGHAESMGSDNHSITSDFPGYLRDDVENGISRGSTAMEGVGGVAIFINGALGSQIGCPSDVTCEDLEGNVWEPHVHEFGKTQCIGENLAVGALKAIQGETEPADVLPIEYRTKIVHLVIENYGYHAMIYNDVFHITRRDYGFDRTKPISENNTPNFDTEISWLRLGPAQAILAPGEMTPELAIGGYDGSHTPECAYDWETQRGTLSRADNPNPPDLSKAPGPPYLFDFLEDLGAQYPMVWGLTNDFLGYFIPPYDYKLAEGGAYIEEAPGDHYEETNSVGPSEWPELERNYIGIFLYR